MAALSAEGTGPPDCSFAVILGPQPVPRGNESLTPRCHASLPPRRMGPAMASSSVPSPPQRPLHRASETVGQPFECCEDRLGSDLSPLGYPNGTDLINALLQACPQARVSPDNPERALRRRGRQRKRRQEAELLQSMVVSSSCTSQPIPASRSSSHKVSVRSRVARFGASCTSATQRCLTPPAPLGSASTLIVPGKTRSAPYRSRSRLT